MRAQLEPHAAERAARLADDADRREAAELLAQLDAASASQSSLIELDARVHRFVHRCSRNPYLARDLDRYLNMSIRIWYITFDRLPPMQDPVHEHRELWRRSPPPTRRRPVRSRSSTCSPSSARCGPRCE